MHDSLFFNRDLSWLEFNARVLDEAFDERNPLLERLKFAAIFSTNLDEFFMVRVAGLRRQVAAGVTQPPPDGLTPLQQLDAIDRRVRELLARQRIVLHETLLPALAEAGVRILRMCEVTEGERATLDAFFESQVFPVLTPLAVDPDHPFPYISNLSLSLAVEIRNPETGSEHLARVKVPKSLPRWVPIGRPNHVVPLEQVIAASLDRLFPGMDVLGSYCFRLTRFSDLELGGLEDPEDLLATIEEQVFRLRFAEVVRLEVQDDTPAHVRAILLEELHEEQRVDTDLAPSGPLGERDVHEMGSLLEPGDLMALAALEIPELRDPPFSPTTPEPLRDRERSIFDVIREHDVLVHHPFDSFATSVERFITTAATDENVLAIKMTLYRTSGDTAIVRALTEAAESGTQVVVLVELKARFDESNNITWARTLEKFGVHVGYGSAQLKTHAKLALVVRRDPDGGEIRRYVHIGTGNYNSETARLYTDVGLFTCDPAIGADVSDLFNSLTGYSRLRDYRRLLVAPSGLRERFIELIGREAAHARAGRPARIIAKMNALVDAAIIEALYDASRAGVEIDLIVRGICCLKPGVAGLSECIRVISIIGRFLEHTRIYHFANDGSPEYYMGSADWMPRNFERRVEAVAPVLDPAIHGRLESLLATCLADNRQAWDLAADGSWTRRRPGDEAERATHRILMQSSWGQATDRAAESEAAHELLAATDEHG